MMRKGLCAKENTPTSAQQNSNNTETMLHSMYYILVSKLRAGFCNNNIIDTQIVWQFASSGASAAIITATE